MKGATEYYRIIEDAYYKKLGDLKNIGCWNGGDSKAYIYNNIIFVTSTHARGECFHVFLVEDSNLSVPQLINSAFEVYGVLGGQPGWTEYYGWKHQGNWVKVVEEYLQNLKVDIEHYNHQTEVEKKKKEDQLKREIENRVNKFNQIFV